MSRHILVPRDRKHLKEMVRFEMNAHGNACDLNHIDVSAITDFSMVFASSMFVGNVSRWNVEQGANFSGMFENSNFNGDVSMWNVSNAERMENMFANSLFAGDVSRWNVQRVHVAAGMFLNAPFDGDLSRWQLPQTEFKDARRLLDFVAHHKEGSRHRLQLPELPVEGYRLFLSKNTMHAWLAEQSGQGNTTRYHWDALLREPDAPWATPEMVQAVQVYLALNTPIAEPCIAHSNVLMQAWSQKDKPKEGALHLPSLDDNPGNWPC